MTSYLNLSDRYFTSQDFLQYLSISLTIQELNGLVYLSKSNCVKCFSWIIYQVFITYYGSIYYTLFLFFSDFTKLGRDFNIDVSSALKHTIDLSTYTNKVLNFESCTRWSMAKLVQDLVSSIINCL